MPRTRKIQSITLPRVTPPRHRSTTPPRHRSTTPPRMLPSLLHRGLSTTRSQLLHRGSSLLRYQSGKKLHRSALVLLCTELLYSGCFLVLRWIEILHWGSSLLHHNTRCLQLLYRDCAPIPMLLSTTQPRHPSIISLLRLFQPTASNLRRISLPWVTTPLKHLNVKLKPSFVQLTTFILLNTRTEIFDWYNFVQICR
jgi:hypothetical protein